MSCAWSGVVRELLSVGMAAIVLLTACGSPAIESTAPSTTDSLPAETTSSQSTTTDPVEPSTTNPPNPTTSGAENEEPAEVYGFGLPEGPRSPAGPVREDEIYLSLEQGLCDEAQAQLDRWWDQMNWPRSVLLYQAAIYVCADNGVEGRLLLDQATNTFGWQGLSYAIDDYMYDCVVYRAVQSVLEQQDPESFPCPDGAPPEWPDGPEDDPRTPEDESTITETTLEGDDTTTSTSA